MDIRLINKKCTNCGANLKLSWNDTTVKCDYCNTQYLVEHEKNNMYKPTDNPNERRLYVNTATEILKWISRILIGVMIACFGFAIMSFSSPIYGVMLVVAGILTMLPYTLKIFFGHIYVKIAIIAVLAIWGFMAGAINSYKLPKEFQGVYKSETTNLTVEIKGNKIIVNDNGHVVKEELYTWSETYGHIVYYNIKVNNGEYNFRICVNRGKGYQFYQAERIWSNEGMHYFYNTKNKTDEYVLGEFSY